jgi:large subunit ribosomal protein L7/L12
MAQLGPFMGSIGGMGGGGGGGAPQQAAKAAEPVKEAEPAKPTEKTHYDIELVKFDQAQKIKVIKEVRALFNLGLKEAKDIVEGCPVWLKKEVKKEDAMEIEAKLKEVGAELRLA